jgi:hypothetical protein
VRRERSRRRRKRNFILSQILVFQNNECKSNKMEFVGMRSFYDKLQGRHFSKLKKKARIAELRVKKKARIAERKSYKKARIAEFFKKKPLN